MNDIWKCDDTEDYLVCPYCGKPQYCHEPEDFTAYVCTTECEHCGREIEYSVEVVRKYYPIIPDEDEDGEKEDE